MTQPDINPRTTFAYDEWMLAQGIPVHRGYFVSDVRTIELGRWEARDCDAAFVQLTGQEGVSEARITEVPPGATLPPYSMALDEIVYVVQGGGATRLWADGNDADAHQFEWEERALFLIPGHHQREFSNLRGDVPVRLLHYDYLPLAMSVVPEPDFFLNAPFRPVTPAEKVRETFSEARLLTDPAGLRWVGGGKAATRKAAYWYGNFFPNMGAWDELEANSGRGAGGRTVSIQFANSDMGCHMSVFDSRTYKKAHRHGPGRVIVVPSGEGYTLMWLEGQDEAIVVPWQEAALFVPPDRWFHQHFNLGARPARYLALHPPMQFHGYAERPEDRRRDQIEYPDENPAIRERFERELAARGLTSLMPDDAYRSSDDAWGAVQPVK